ncbi:MAG: toll/interleukin-1 receptor domain-containing protein [Hyphomonadaceae bacterium]
MSYVFISHASPDKPRIRPVVDALMAAGFKIWLDNPAATGYRAEEIRKFYRIRAGGRWEDEIDDALRGAACVLVCWSSKAVTEKALKLKERSVWFNEAYYAKTAGTMLACLVEPINPAELPGTLSAQQLPDLSPEQDRARWDSIMVSVIDDVRRKLQQQFELRQRTQSTRDVFAPYLADRSAQETLVHESLGGMLSGGGVKPLFVTGPDNERLDEFLTRLRMTSAEVLPDSSVWEDCEVEWPVGVHARVFAQHYRRNLARALKLQGEAEDSAIAADLERRGRPIALVHRMLAKEWGPDEGKRVLAWLEFWGGVARVSAKVKAIPLLQLKMPSARPGWKRCPPGASGGRVGNRGIWRSVESVAKRATRQNLLSFTPLPVLSPISHGDADRWLNRLYREPGAERTRIEETMDAIYRKGRAKRHGLAHKDFAALVTPLFEGAGRQGGQT